jgi:hypothetical protein
MCCLTATLHVCDPANQVLHSTHITYSWMTDCYFQAKTPAVDHTVPTDWGFHSWTVNVQLNLKYSTRTTNETVICYCWFTSLVLLVWIIQEESSANTKVTNTVAAEREGSTLLVVSKPTTADTILTQFHLTSITSGYLRSIQKYNN